MELDIIKTVPSGYDPSPQIMRWADMQNPYALPSNKVFILGKGPEWTADQVLARGMTQIQHNDMSGVSPGDVTALQNAGKTYHSVPITPTLLGIGATGPNEWVGTFPNTYNRLYFPSGLPDYAGGFAYGDSCEISHKITVGETMENTHYTNPDSAFWGGYYERKYERLNARFGAGNWMMAHDYLFINVGPDWHNITETQARNYFRNPTTLPNYHYLTGTLKRINMFCGSGYLAGMDRDSRYVYDIALKGRMYKDLNRHFVCYWDPEREWMPNMKNGHRMPPGILFRENKMPCPPTITAGLVGAGLHFGAGFIGWNTMGRVTNKIWATYWMGLLAPGSFYVKNGETTQSPWQEWPYLSGDASYNFVQWSANADIAAFEAKAYAATLGQVEGGITKPAKYKINNGSWYNPVNTYHDDLCYAKYNKQPIVETVMKDGREAIYFTDPCSNNVKKTITIEGQTGQIYTFPVCGNMPHFGIANINLSI